MQSSYYTKNRNETSDISKNQNRRRTDKNNVRKDKNYRKMKNNSSFSDIKHRKKDRRTSAPKAMVKVISPELLSSETDDDFDANAWPICSPLSPMPSPSPPISVSSGIVYDMCMHV